MAAHWMIALLAVVAVSVSEAVSETTERSPGERAETCPAIAHVEWSIVVLSATGWAASEAAE